MHIPAKTITTTRGESIVLRSPTPADAAQLLHFMQTVFAESWYNLSYRAETVAGFTEEYESSFISGLLNNPRAFNICAFDRGRIVGNCTFRGKTADLHLHCGELGMSVLQANWGSGIGSALLTYCLESAQSLGIGNVQLSVRSSNDRAIALYERHGFRRVGVIRQSANLGDRFSHDFLFQRIASEFSQTHDVLLPAQYGVDPFLYTPDHYDALNSSDAHDLPFYLDLARRCQGPVLELCCGSGRLTVPMAEAGIEMTGLDFTEPMLQRAIDKARTKNVNIRFVNGDMRSFSLDQHYGLIIIPFNSLQNTYTDTDITAVFDCVRRHLAPGGLFVFSVFNPNIHLMVERSIASYMYHYNLPDGRHVEIEESMHYNAETQINRVFWTYRIEGEPEPITRRLDMRCFYPRELDILVEKLGWTIVNKFGWYDRSAFGPQSRQQIVLCSPIG